MFNYAVKTYFYSVANTVGFNEAQHRKEKGRPDAQK
jgi:hypothetical protein